MKLPSDPRLPLANDTLRSRLTDLLRDSAKQVNLMSEGRLAAVNLALTAAPTTGTYAQGDLVRNSDPTETGSAPNTYVVFGWLCVASGTPGTWVPLNIPTDAFGGGGVGSAYETVEDEGTPLTQRDTLNFVGPAVTVTDSGSKTVVTIDIEDAMTAVADTGSPILSKQALWPVNIGGTQYYIELMGS